MLDDSVTPADATMVIALPTDGGCAICGGPLEDPGLLCASCSGTPGDRGAAQLVDGRYAIIGELGSGAMGVVYLARDVGLGRDVALKLIAPRALAAPGAAGRFRDEAAALASIRNDNIVSVYAFGPHDGSLFFAMEYVAGRTLEELIVEHARHGSTIPVHRALTLLTQVARGLAAVHARGLVHRDVKPANIVVEDGTARPVLVDFGLALRDAPDAPEAERGGTPAYMAPEQGPLALPSTRVTLASDVYSLGCTAFELLTGRQPFLGDSIDDLLRQHAEAPPPLLSAIRPELASLSGVIARCLAKRPELRFESCALLADALEEAGAAWLEVFRGASTMDLARTGSFPAAEPTAVRVLVIDDDDAFRRFATRAAQLAFYRTPVKVVSVASGEEAVREARRAPPHLVLLDYDMPGLDGVMTLSALRALPEGAAARVIVLSASAGSEQRWRFGAMGVSHFVSKPVPFEQLVEGLASVAQRAGLGAPPADDDEAT